MNEEARKFIHALMDEGADPEDTPDSLPVRPPGAIDAICNDLLECIRAGGERKKHSIYKNVVCMGEDYFLRAIPIHRISRDGGTSHVMITVERFSTRLTADINKIGARYRLTKRETEVLKGLARGMTNRDISGLLFISEHTVKDHVRSLMQKMGVNNRSMLICRIFEGNQ